MTPDHHVNFSLEVHVETVQIVLFHTPVTTAVNIPKTTTTITALHLEIITIIILSVGHGDKVRLITILEDLNF